MRFFRSRAFVFILIFTLVFVWDFSGWPPLAQNFPQKPLIVRAATYTETDNTAGSSSWTAPPGVTSVAAECWGAGGAGGGSTSATLGGSGGGGGAYAKTASVAVTPGNTYTVTVGTGGTGSTGAGTAGGDSSFVGDSSQQCLADGGLGGAANGGTAGTGGRTASSTGDSLTKFGGGGGFKTVTTVGGGGGGSGGTAATGTTATTQSGATAVADGGPGGAGGNIGVNGSTPASGPGGGGGGSGCRLKSGACSSTGTSHSGGPGYAGQVRITYTIYTILGNGASEPSNVTIGPGDPITDLDNFTLQDTTSTDAVTALVVTLGPTGAFNNIAQVDITDTSNVAKCTAISGLTSNTVTFSTCTIPVTTSVVTYKVRITPKSALNMPSPPGASYDVTGTVTSFTSTNVQTGSDTGSATVIVDNASPSDVASVSGSVNGTNVILSWTNPSDSDFATTTVLRSASAISNYALTEGTAYATGTVVGSATVACVVGGGASASVGCTDSGLSSGTYNYKIFAADTYANYATGTAPTGSPFTISVVATISCSTDVASTDFGALTSGSISTALSSASTTMSCANTGAGCSLYIKDAGGSGSPGLWNSSNSYLLPSPNAAFSTTATLAPGTEGYGIQAATTAAGSGGTLTLNSRYAQTGNVVGGLTLADLVLASSTVDVTGREVVVVHKAAISGATLSGNYSDTITYSCLAN